MPSGSKAKRSAPKASTNPTPPKPAQWVSWFPGKDVSRGPSAGRGWTWASRSSSSLPFSVTSPATTTKRMEGSALTARRGRPGPPPPLPLRHGCRQ